MDIRDLFGDLRRKIVGKHIKIVFPEGDDDRILRAAARLKMEGLCEPLILGQQAEVDRLLTNLGFVNPGLTIIDPTTYEERERLKSLLCEKRAGKLTAEEADKLMTDINYLGVLMVEADIAQGMVSGAAHSTADTVRPALQIIKTKLGVTRVSGIFLMMRDGKSYIFGDCAIIIDPDAEALAEIAINSSDTARFFGIDPKIAMISYSTKGSGVGPRVDKVVEATRLVQERRPDLLVDGELQLDAALVPFIASKKAPDSPVAGQANVLIFPGVQSSNIAYKAVEHFAGYEAVGPILQGLNKPVNDLSRGCSAEDVYKLAIITAAQSITY